MDRLILRSWMGVVLAMVLGGVSPLHGQNPAQIHAEVVTLHEFGSEEAAFLALPSQPPKAAVLLLPDALGPRQVVEQRCLLLARLGYLAVALDFYDGQMADDTAEAARLRQRADTRRTRTAIEAALKLVLESPRYRCPRLVIAVWGDHVEALAEGLLSARHAARVAQVSVIEPGEANAGNGIKMLREQSIPLQFIVRQEAAGDFKRTQGAAFTGRVPMDLFSGAPGFMLKEGDPPAAVEAWSLIIDSWERRLQGQDLTVREVPMSPAPEAATEATPEAPPSSRRPLSPRQGR
jgi:hypothetical protein